MNRRLTMATLAFLALASTAACGGDDEPAVTTTAPKGKATAIAVDASEYRFTAPGEVQGGLVTVNFKNSGKLKHEAALLAIGDKPPDQALKEFHGAQGFAPIPPSLGYGGGVGGTRAGTTQTSTFQVKEGNYLLVCTLTDRDTQEDALPVPDESPPHYTLGMSSPLKVSAGPMSPLPPTEGTIVAKEVTARQYTFDVPPLTGGRHELAFRNDGPQQFHEAQLLEFPAGVDEARAQQAFMAVVRSVATGQAPPPGTPLPSQVPGTGVGFAPGLGGTFTVDLKAGRTYLIGCFIQDRQGGAPHAVAQGMMKFVTVR